MSSFFKFTSYFILLHFCLAFTLAYADCSVAYDDKLVLKSWKFDRSGSVAQKFLANNVALPQLAIGTSKEEMALAWYKYAHVNGTNPEKMGALFTSKARKEILDGMFNPTSREDFLGEFFEFYDEFCRRKGIGDSVGGIDALLKTMFSGMITNVDSQTRRFGPTRESPGDMIIWKVEENAWRVDSVIVRKN